MFRKTLLRSVAKRESENMASDSESGFVKRGFYLLIGMILLAGVVLAILFGRPQGGTQPTETVDLSGVSESAPGWRIRYSAAISLAKRHSTHVPWKSFEEMLDEKQQLRNFQDGAGNAS